MYIELREWEVNSLFRQLLIDSLIHIPKQTPVVTIGCPTTNKQHYSVITKFLYCHHWCSRFCKGAFICCKHCEDSLTCNINIIAVTDSNIPIETTVGRLRIVVDNIC